MNIPTDLINYSVDIHYGNQPVPSQAMVATESSGDSAVYAFGDPEPVLKDNLYDFLGVFVDSFSKYYLPPVSLTGLAKTMNANAHHGAILKFKRNMLAKWFKPSDILSYADFRKAALDFQVFGMAYFQVVYNMFGQIRWLRHRPALMIRPGIEPGVFFEIQDYLHYGYPIEYKPGEIVCIKEYDVKQGIYGEPEYFSGIQSVLLSEEAGLYRRKFYRNGANVGYILVTENAGLSKETAETIENTLKAGKGPGNFKSLYINIPKATQAKEPVRVIPIGDIKTADDIAAIKNITKSEILAMHRMQPGIAGVIPENMTGFGDLEKVMRVYVELEVPPMQQPWLALNAILPTSGRIAFDPPAWANAA